MSPPLVRIGEVARVKSGFAFSSKDWTDSGVPVVKIANVKDGSLDMSGCSYVSDEVAASGAAYRLRRGDILIAMTGYVGEVALVRTDTQLLLNQRVGRFTINESKVDPGYFFQLVHANGFKVAAQSLGYGSAQPNVSPTLLESIVIPLPPLAEQRGIAVTLGALDDKIESNRRIVDLAPRLMQALVTQGLEREPTAVAVADLARFVNGGAYTKGASGVGRMVVRIAELNSGPGASTVYSEIGVPDEETARAGDLLMSWSGSLGVYRWVLDEAIINQHIFKVLPSDGYPPWLVYDRLARVMPQFQGIAKDKATTMGHIQRGHLESTVVAVPNSSAIAALDQKLSSLWDRLLLAERENVKLSQLRMALLPELLSGRIRVSEAHEAVG